MLKTPSHTLPNLIGIWYIFASNNQEFYIAFCNKYYTGGSTCFQESIKAEVSKLNLKSETLM